VTDQQTGLVPQQPQQAGMTLGQQQLDPGDIVPPRVKIVQQMSQEAQGGKNARAEPGDFFNTLTQANYGPELSFIPIITFKQRIMLVRENRRKEIDGALTAARLEPLSDGDGLKCRSFDMIQGIGEPGILCHDCPLSRWDGNEPPLCTETYNVAGLRAEDGELIIASFSKSSAKVGKRVFSIVRMSPAKPWTRVLTATTREVTNAQGTFFVPDVAVAQESPMPELLRTAEYWNRELGGRAAIDITPVEEDDVDQDREPAPASESSF